MTKPPTRKQVRSALSFYESSTRSIRALDDQPHDQVSTQNAESSVIANELREAVSRMTPRERALNDALMDTAGELQDAACMLHALARLDADYALLLAPVIILLWNAGLAAVQTHTEVIANINESVIH